MGDEHGRKKKVNYIDQNKRIQKFSKVNEKRFHGEFAEVKERRRPRSEVRRRRSRKRDLTARSTGDEEENFITQRFMSKVIRDREEDL